MDLEKLHSPIGDGLIAGTRGVFFKTNAEESPGLSWCTAGRWISVVENLIKRASGTEHTFPTQKLIMMRYAARFTERLRFPWPSESAKRKGGFVQNFTDRDVLCVDCGSQFVFSSGEQQFYREKGFTHDPKHCKQCKTRRELVKTGNRPRRVETPVTCAECGNHTTVPFKPTQKKPVLCATCFRRKAGTPHDIVAA